MGAVLAVHGGFVGGWTVRSRSSATRPAAWSSRRSRIIRPIAHTIYLAALWPPPGVRVAGDLRTFPPQETWSAEVTESLRPLPAISIQRR